MLTSQAVELFDELELRTVLGHEAGHILADHVLYMTALEILLALGTGPLPLRRRRCRCWGSSCALLEWFRAAELTSDRAATLVTRDPHGDLPDADGHLRGRDLAAAEPRRVRRARRPSTRTGTRAWTACAACRASSPRRTRCPVRRVRELMRWVQSGEYDRIMGGEYVRRGQERGARDEATDAFAFYSERFRGFFRDASDTVSKVGDQLGDATGKLGEWMRGTLGR